MLSPEELTQIFRSFTPDKSHTKPNRGVIVRWFKHEETGGYACLHESDGRNLTAKSHLFRVFVGGLPLGLIEEIVSSFPTRYVLVTTSDKAINGYDPL